MWGDKRKAREESVTQIVSYLVCGWVVACVVGCVDWFEEDTLRVLWYEGYTWYMRVRCIPDMCTPPVCTPTYVICLVSKCSHGILTLGFFACLGFPDAEVGVQCMQRC